MKNSKVNAFLGTLLSTCCLALTVQAAELDGAGPVPMTHPGQPMGLPQMPPPDMERGMGVEACGPLPPPLLRIRLSELQCDKIFALTHALAPGQRERSKAIHQAQDNLRTLTLSAQFDETKARTLADTIARNMAENELQQAKLFQQIRVLLTPEQRQQLDAPTKGPGHDARGEKERPDSDAKEKRLPAKR